MLDENFGKLLLPEKVLTKKRNLKQQPTPKKNSITEPNTVVLLNDSRNAFNGGFFSG